MSTCFSWRFCQCFPSLMLLKYALRKTTIFLPVSGWLFLHKAAPNSPLKEREGNSSQVKSSSSTKVPCNNNNFASHFAKHLPTRCCLLIGSISIALFFSCFHWLKTSYPNYLLTWIAVFFK